MAFVCRSCNELRRCRPSLLQVQSCHCKHVVVGSWQNVAFVVIVSEKSCVLVLVLDMYYRMYFTIALVAPMSHTADVWCGIWRIVNFTYHSSVKWLIANAIDVSTLHQFSVFHCDCGISFRYHRCNTAVCILQFSIILYWCENSAAGCGVRLNGSSCVAHSRRWHNTGPCTWSSDPVIMTHFLVHSRYLRCCSSVSFFRKLYS